MNEYIAVEFIAKDEDRDELIRRLDQLKEDLVVLERTDEFEEEDAMVLGMWYRVTGKISSTRASLIKLQDSFLAERMRVSYIPDELKDKYRKKK